MDVLRALADTPPETVQLTPMRNKAAQFVLEKFLNKVEHQLASSCFPAPQMGIASTLHLHARHEDKILYMAEADWGAVKLIDLVFDAVIDQGKIDLEGVWLLNRFRFPLFHSVLTDYSFFFARQNLARRFINAVTLHLLSTRGPFARELKFVLGGLATRMHESFDDGLGQFNVLCLEGQTWFATQQQRLHKAELKIREQAKTRSRKQQAEERVISLLNRCIAEKTLPQLLVAFIVGEWRQTLLWTSMKEGEQGLNWKRQARLTESMVAFASGCQTREGRTQYQNFLPSLLKGIRSSLKSVHEREARVSQAMEPVELVLNALLLGASPEMESHPGLPLPEVRKTEFEVTLESNPAMERILALQPGQWVRFKTQDKQFEPCALVVKGELGESWSFVNQSGQGVVSKTPAQLSALLTSGVLEIVGEGHAFDEVMNNIIADVFAKLPKPAVVLPTQRPAVAMPSAAVASDTTPLADPELVALDATLRNTEDRLESKDRLDSKESLEDEEPISDEVMQTSFAAVDGLQIGARLVWYKSEQEDVTLKLAVKTRAGEKLIFVNHIGIKALDTDRKKLARLIASGRMVIIDIGSKFDSALERIVKHIQQDKK